MESTTQRKRRDIKGDARRERIVELLQQGGGDLAVEELAERLGVSFATVRRDLARLRNDGAVARTYGGVALLPRAEVPARDRQTERWREKDAIGRLAADLVEAGELLIVDAGSTTARFASQLSGIADLTVVTNGVAVINSLLAHPGPDVIVLGGQLRGINETITGGPAEEMLAGLRASRTFIGTDAIDPERGIASRTFAQSRLKSLMMRNAREIVVLADSSKLEAAEFGYWSAIPSRWTLVTDSGATRAQLDMARLAGAEDIRIAEID